MKKISFCLSLFVILCFVTGCFAADDFTISESVYNDADKSIRFLINDNRETGQSPNSATASVDGSDLSNVSIKLLKDSDVPVTFVFVVDNTTTSYSDQKSRPAEIADVLTKGRSNKNDEYYLISYDTEVHSPVGPSKYPSDVLDKLTYNVKETKSDYSEALLKAVELLKKENSFWKKVIILISDGYQTDDPRMQQGELIDELTKAGYPVYACGLMRSETSKYEEADLKKLSDISERTGGKYFSYESNKTPGKDILNHINKSLDVKGTLADDYSRNKEGAVEAVVHLMRNNSEISSANTQVLLPAVKLTKTAEPENNPDTKSETDTCENPDDPNCKEQTFFDKIKSPLKDNFGDNWILVFIAGCLMVILIILVILTIVKRNSGEVFEEVPSESENKANQSGIPDEIDERTAVIPDKQSLKITLDDMKTRKRANLIIGEGESRVFGRMDKKNPKNDVFIITIDDPYIARRQFMISVNGGKALIKDLGSLNGTYLNGDKVTGEVVLQSGSKIRIGDVAGEREFAVTVEKA